MDKVERLKVELRGLLDEYYRLSEVRKSLREYQNGRSFIAIVMMTLPIVFGFEYKMMIMLGVYMICLLLGLFVFYEDVIEYILGGKKIRDKVNVVDDRLSNIQGVLLRRSFDMDALLVEGSRSTKPYRGIIEEVNVVLYNF